MNNTVYNVETTVTIYFNDGSYYELPLKDSAGTGLDNYCTSIELKEQLYTKNNNNIIGNVCANTLSLKIKSKDGLLISSNENSTYFGLMDETAYIDVSCTGDDNVTTYMGRYFVDAWENGVTAATANDVSISAIDLLGKLKNIPLKKIKLQRELDVNTYLKSVIDALNNELPLSMRINYRNQDLDIFHNSGYNWQLWYNNINRDSFENILNNISQNTLSNLWIDRDRYFKTDWLLDDSSELPVGDLSGAVQILDYGTNIADTDKASGVEITYIDNVSYEDKELASINNYPVTTGDNVVENLHLNSDKVINISTVQIIPTSASNYEAYTKDIYNYKDSVDLTIHSSTSTDVNIKIWGTVINEITNTLVEYNNNNNKNNLISIDNRILRKELINTYKDGLLDLISYRNSNIYVEGFLNPQLKIGDIVSVRGSKLGIYDYYKIIGLDFKLGTSYRCRATLLKTFGEV